MILKINQESEIPVINLVIDTLQRNKQALVFANTKISAEKTAEDISKALTKTEKLSELSNSILNCLTNPTKQCKRLAECVNNAVAFHHSGLISEQRRLIEENFRNGVIKIICCTPTLAYGVDMPAFRTIIKDLKRYGYRGMTWIPVLEFLQIAGRSGRPKYDTEGQAICIANTESEKDEITRRFIVGEPEIIDSKLAVEPILRTYLLSLISSNFISTKDELVNFFKKTFWAFHFKDMDRLIDIVDKMLALLFEWGFLETSGHGMSDFYSGDELPNRKFRATLIGKRVSELYIDPWTANYIIRCLNNCKEYQIIEPFLLLQMIFHTNELRPLFSVKQKEYRMVEEMLVKYNSSFFERTPNNYDLSYEDFLDSVKTAIVFHNWIEEDDEESILEEFNVRPGELRAKLELADWILYAVEEIARLTKFMRIIGEIKKLRLRLRYGAGEELLPLLMLEGIGRVRARKLYSNGIRNLMDVKNADTLKLTQLLGENIGKDIKKQVDMDVGPIALRKRKGQINIMNY